MVHREGEQAMYKEQVIQFLQTIGIATESGFLSPGGHLFCRWSWMKSFVLEMSSVISLKSVVFDLMLEIVRKRQ